MSNSPDPALTVPRLLYGPKRSQSHQRWKVIAKKAAKTGSWEAALRDVEMMPLSEVKGDFSCSNAHGAMYVGDILWVDDTFETLFHATADFANASEGPNAWAKLLERLTLSGLDHFWFALFLGVSGVGIVMWRDESERRRAASLCLEKLLRWWPTLCIYDQRYSAGPHLPQFRGWPEWCAGLCNLCSDIGVGQEDITRFTEMDAFTAGKTAAQWLEDSRRIT
jgi:hypothetical protein